MFWNKRKKTRKDKGFTLLELLVVLSIIGLVAALFFVSYRGIEKEISLNHSAHKLAQDIRRVQSMAMAAEEVNGNIPEEYKLYINLNGSGPSNKYTLYADFGNYKEDIESVKLEGTTYFDEINFYSGPQIRELELSFSPPDPIIKIARLHGHAPPMYRNEVEIILKYDNDSPQKKIIFNKSGLIEVQ
jgi:prepilin-type N-terminal cleavage/methylation domain-containing protein